MVNAMLNRRQIYIYFIILLGLIFILDKVVYLSAKHILSFSSYRFIDFYKQSKTYDILILGNSRANQSLPRFKLNGFTIKNFGEGWAGLPQHTAMAHDYISLHGAPKYLMIETHFLDYSGTGRKQGAVQAIFSPRIEQEIAADMTDSERIIRQLIWTSRLNEPNLIPAIARIFVKSTNNYGSLSSVIRPEDIKHAKNNATKVKFKDVTKVKLAELIGKINALGTTVYLVTTPIFGEPNDRFIGFEQFIEDVDTFSATHNVLHLDLSNWSKNKIFFSDTTHLNDTGAEKLAEDLSTCFLSQGTFTDSDINSCKNTFPSLNVIQFEAIK